MFALAGLDFEVDVEQGDGGGSDAGKARGLADGLRTKAGELLLHLAREAADGGVVEPVGDGFGFGFLEALDGFLLLLEIAGVLDFGFDRFEFDPDGARERRCVSAIKRVWTRMVESRAEARSTAPLKPTAGLNGPPALATCFVFTHIRQKRADVGHRQVVGEEFRGELAADGSEVVDGDLGRRRSWA